MKRVLFSMVLLLVASFTFAQEKNVKEAKSIANGVNPDFAKAEELINQALTNPETKDNAETWDVAGLIQRKRSEKEMENAYLRKPYDTLQVYNSALNMCKFYFKCDELAQIPNEKGKIKNKYRKSNSATILAERGNTVSVCNRFSFSNIGLIAISMYVAKKYNAFLLSSLAASPSFCEAKLKNWIPPLIRLPRSAKIVAELDFLYLFLILPFSLGICANSSH